MSAQDSLNDKMKAIGSFLKSNSLESALNEGVLVLKNGEGDAQIEQQTQGVDLQGNGGVVLENSRDALHNARGLSRGEGELSGGLGGLSQDESSLLYPKSNLSLRDDLVNLQAHIKKLDLIIENILRRY